jgi:CRP-like cAMP-binding protein
MSHPHDILVRKLQAHSDLSASDVRAVRAVPHVNRTLSPNIDIVRQGDKPRGSVIVLHGMVARYHTLRSGGRQYLSLHITGDLPDAQSLFIERMDHGVCAIDTSEVAVIPHSALLVLFLERPAVGIALWRETLIDAAIFRAAITNNSGRPLQARLAHVFCEQYYRARANGVAKPGSCRLPLSQTQLGEMVGASLPSITRALRALRQTGAMDWRGGQLHVHDWRRMVELGEFDPGYLHLRKPSRL